MLRLLLSVSLLLSCAWPLSAAVRDDMLTNLPGHSAPGFHPGALILLPNGERAIIEQALPNGQWKTDLGIILSPEGVIVEGPENGERVTLLPPQPLQKQPGKPEPAQPLHNESEKAPVAEQPPVAQKPDTPQKPVAIAPEQPEAQTQPEQLTLAELLPMTRVPEQPEIQPIEPKEKPKREEPKARKPEQKPEPKKPAEEKKLEEKPAPKPQKARPGQELRIPPEAAKTGNLDFLEGCWQGTRPEYYSKRAIRECFCFGANGKNGKRRVFDPIGRRQCIGASRATLSKNGVLSVTSSGAACNDGERWGQAEMVCRNSGPKTPCSWVFRDANNASQSYEIPFVRVESCGR